MARRMSALPRISLCLSALVLAHASSASAQTDPATSPIFTLAECYALALKQSETIAIKQEVLKETEGRFLQAFSGILPHVSFSMSEKRQNGSGGSAFTLREIPERKFVFTQPLFSGFKEFAAIAGARAERRQRHDEEARAKQLLFVDVANAFHLLLEEREDLQALETIRAALMARIDELKDRERLGRSRSSEVVSAESQLRRIEADLEQARSQEITARQLLEFLTGYVPLEGLEPDRTTAGPLNAEEDYLKSASMRSDVRASEEAWRIAKDQIVVAQSQFWPTVNLQGDRYTKRVGASADVDWDVLLTVDVPLFQGGKAMGSVRQAAAQAREARLNFQKTQREAELEIRNAHAQFQQALARMAALKKALEASEDNYRLQQEDYLHNLVNNLEVLQALQTLENTRRDVIHAAHETKRLYWQLQAATGKTF